MLNKEQYQAAFAHLHASGAPIRQEAKLMKKGRIRKSAAITAAVAALSITAAGAANAATDGALLESICVVFRCEVQDTQTNPDGTTTYSVKGEDGNNIAVTVTGEPDAPRGVLVNGDGSADSPSFYVQVKEDGSVTATAKDADTPSPAQEAADH